MITERNQSKAPGHESFEGDDRAESFAFPMTTGQRRFWLLDQLGSGNAALIVPLAIKLTGHLDVPVLTRAIDEVRRRHEMLRTVFVSMHGELKQIIQPFTPTLLPMTDFSQLPEPDKGTAIQREIAAENRRSFSLEQGPLLRTRLFRLHTTEHLLLLMLHHIACDGWSNGILTREVGQIYDALVQGKTPLLPELSLQFADYAHWQKQSLENNAWQDSLDWWKENLRGASRALNLPTDQPRPATRVFPGQIRSLRLPPDLVGRAKLFCQREGLTPYMLYVSVYVLLLSRYSNQDDIIIVSPIANRRQVELEGVIGLFASLLLLRANSSGNPIATEFLKRMRSSVLDSFAHDEFPFERLAEELSESETRFDAHWLRAYFSYQRPFVQPAKVHQLEISPIAVPSPGTLFEWMFMVIENQASIDLTLEYRPDLFDSTTIDRVLLHFQTLLDAIIKNPAKRIEELTILIPAARQQPKADWRETEDKNRSSRAVQFVAPSTPTEVALAKIWCELLGVDQIGIHDNFFAIGGHSLLAFRMVNEIKRQMASDMLVRMLYQYATIQELAKVLSAQKFTERKPELVQLQAGNSGPELFFIIDGDSVGLFKLSRFMAKDLRLYASVVPLSESVLKASAKKQFSALPRMEDLAADHVALIKNRQKNGPVLLVGYCFAGMLAFEVAQQLQAAGIKVEAVLMLNTWMTWPTSWWERKAWLREHLGKLFQQGPIYLWRKSQQRISKKKTDMAATLELAIHNDFKVQMPRSVTARINRHAMIGYRPTALASRGILFAFEDDFFTREYRALDESLGASKMFTGGLEVINVPANHAPILDEAHLTILAGQIHKCLEQFR